MSCRSVDVLTGDDSLLSRMIQSALQIPHLIDHDHEPGRIANRSIE